MAYPEQLSLSIDVIKGGFILSYPIKIEGEEYSYQQREIFTSSRKMNQRLKEVLEAISTTPVDAD